MANKNKTVEQICEWLKMLGPFAFKSGNVVGEILAAHNREIAAKDAEIAKLKRENFDLKGLLFIEQELAEKRNALIKKLVAAFEHLKRKICRDKRVNCKSRGNLSICKYCELIEKAREVVK